jgi:hypothetical protein
LLSASERSATISGVQLGAAAQEDDRRGNTASDAGRGGASVAGSPERHVLERAAKGNYGDRIVKLSPPNGGNFTVAGSLRTTGNFGGVAHCCA